MTVQCELCVFQFDRPFEPILAVSKFIYIYIKNCQNIDLQELVYCLFLVLYIDVYVLKDDASICHGSLMRTKHLCVLIHIRIKGEVVSAVKDV